MVKHIIKKALGMIPGLLWWMIKGSNCVYFFRRNAVSVEKRGDGIV